MAKIRPFAAIRPRPSLAAQVSALPYDVVSREDAWLQAKDNPLSFFHISRPDIHFPSSKENHWQEIHKKGREVFFRLLAEGSLYQDEKPYYYLYRLTMGKHSQTGLVALANCQEYLDNIIKKHELTRQEKEDDRTWHIKIIEAQTGPAFLIYKSDGQLNRLFHKIQTTPPEIDFIANDGVRHSSWTITDADIIEKITEYFSKIPALYIADGHHRIAAANRIYKEWRGLGGSAWFLSVIFPHDQVQILPYNRVVTDLNGLTPQLFLDALRNVFEIHDSGRAIPRLKHEICMYFQWKWRTLKFKSDLIDSSNPINDLDVHLLQKHVLKPILGIDDPRTSKRIAFVGGIKGPKELERLVDIGQFTCAFSLKHVSVDDLIHIADSGEVMPPKSTWFEPKLRDGLFSYQLWKPTLP